MTPLKLSYKAPLKLRYMAPSKLSYMAHSKLSYVALLKLSYMALLKLSYMALSSSSLREELVVLMQIYGACAILMQTYGESEQTSWLSKRPCFFINNCLSSTICVILCSQSSRVVGPDLDCWRAGLQATGSLGRR